MKIISNITEYCKSLFRKLSDTPLHKSFVTLREKHGFLRVDNDNKAGTYLTVIFHLIVIIILLSWSIHVQLARDTSFVIDFSAQEEKEAEEARKRMEENMKEEVKAELDALLNASRGQNQQVRNVAVDASKPLRDDRYEHPEDIYKEARELQERLNQSRRDVEEALSSDDQAKVYKEDKGRKAKAYQGPSVISYTLDGRKAMNLPVPAYKCIGSGDVSVSIIVNRKGYVIGSKIIEGVSSTDQCLRDYALKAASVSRFTASQNAPERQAGEIVYRFVAQ